MNLKPHMIITQIFFITSSCFLGKKTNSDSVIYANNEMIASFDDIKNPLSIKSLDINNISLEKMPDIIYKCENIEDISITFNVKDLIISKKIEHLQKLKKLTIIHSGNISFSKEFYSLPNLEFLNLIGNEINHLDDEICRMKNLKTLFLADTELKTLPQCICEMQGLHNLNIQINNLDPELISKVKSCLPNCKF